MTENRKTTALIRVCLVALFVTLILVLNHGFASYSAGDPDRYYHLRLVQIEADGGRISTLPQAEDIGWGRSFTDKEYLFHLLGRIAYRLGGSSSVLALTPLLASAIVVTLLLASLSITLPGLAAWSCFVLVFLSPHFYWRTLLLRPHLLAIEIFVLLLVGALKGHLSRPFTSVLLFLGVAAYVLAYHAFYIPCFLLGGLGVLSLFDPAWKRLVLAGGAGLLVGILVNPYFPGTVEMMLMHAGAGGDGETNTFLGAGSELLPFSLTAYFRFYSLHWAIVGLGFGALVRSGKSEIRASRDLQGVLLLSLLGALFLLMTWLSPRAAEYATPVCILLAAYLGRFFVLRKIEIRTLFTTVAFLSLCHLLLVGGAYLGYVTTWTGLSPHAGEWNKSRAALEALQALPPEAKGRKIFHCEWDLGSLIFYARPDMRFVDLLDPHFLLMADPEKTLDRIGLIRGVPTDLHELVTSRFHSQYILCVNRNVLGQLERDARFTRLFPPRSAPLETLSLNAPALYSVR